MELFDGEEERRREVRTLEKEDEMDWKREVRIFTAEDRSGSEVCKVLITEDLRVGR